MFAVGLTAIAHVYQMNSHLICLIIVHLLPFLLLKQLFNVFTRFL